MTCHSRGLRFCPAAGLYTAAPTTLKKYALDRVASWHPDVTTLIGLWDVSTVQPLTLCSDVPTAAWQSTNVTVPGDPVHAMSPALGLVTNTALRDAQVLGAELLAAAHGDKPPCCPPSATTKRPCAPTDSTRYAHSRSWVNASSGTVRCPLDPASDAGLRPQGRRAGRRHRRG